MLKHFTGSRKFHRGMGVPPMGRKSPVAWASRPCMAHGQDARATCCAQGFRKSSLGLPLAALCVLAAGLVMAQQADVKTCELKLDFRKHPINDHSRNLDLPSYGFTCSRPLIGGEAEALEYRKRGALLLRTEAVDDATMAFFARYNIKAIVQLRGDRDHMSGAVERMSQGIATNVVIGFEIEPCDESGAAEVAEKWKAIFPAMARGFPRARVILPLSGDKADAAIVKAFGTGIRRITHILFQIPDGSLSPYAAASKFKWSSAMLKHMRFILVLPGKVPGKQDAGALESVLWKMHAMIEGLIVSGVDAVIFDEWPENDTFAYAMRNAGALLRNRREFKVMAHGEASQSKQADADEAMMALLDGDAEIPSLSGEGIPFSCGDFGKALLSGRTKGAGDVSWVACTYTRWGGQYVGLLIVNSSESLVQLDVRVHYHTHRAPTYWTIGRMPDGTIERHAWEPDVKPTELFIEARPGTFECVLFPIMKNR